MPLACGRKSPPIFLLNQGSAVKDAIILDRLFIAPQSLQPTDLAVNRLAEFATVILASAIPVMPRLMQWCRENSSRKSQLNSGSQGFSMNSTHESNNSGRHRLTHQPTLGSSTISDRYRNEIDAALIRANGGQQSDTAIVLPYYPVDCEAGRNKEEAHELEKTYRRANPQDFLDNSFQVDSKETARSKECVLKTVEMETSYRFDS